MIRTLDDLRRIEAVRSCGLLNAKSLGPFPAYSDGDQRRIELMPQLQEIANTQSVWDERRIRRLTESMIRAIVRQAEAERESRAKVINAEGEQQAAQKLLEVAEITARDPGAMQLRYLSSLNFIAGDKRSTIAFPFPMDLASMVPGMKKDG